MQLLEVLDKWIEALDNDHYVDCIYMDFQKAFDKVPHKRLLEKIKSYGIPVVGPTLNSLHNGHCLKLQSIYPILPVIVVKWSGQI
jgi:hypothetical protein